MVCGLVKPPLCSHVCVRRVFVRLCLCVSNPSFRECVPAQCVCMWTEITSHDLGQVYRILWIRAAYMWSLCLWVCGQWTVWCVSMCLCEGGRERKCNIEIKSVSVCMCAPWLVCVFLSQITLNLSFNCRPTIWHDITSDIAGDITGDNTGCPFLIAILICWLQNLGGFDTRYIYFRVDHYCPADTLKSSVFSNMLNQTWSVIIIILSKLYCNVSAFKLILLKTWINMIWEHFWLNMR